MPDLTIWFSRADFIEMGEFLAEEGSKFGKFWKKNWSNFGSAAERSSFNNDNNNIIIIMIIMIIMIII